ncbi:hypothetical protein [Paraliobacillus ryukyuensis]|uniref:hypothetical protein n=1 Tax=Paraliobacillus ryukyuensis TaxID=200904 RepID=UPI0009A78F2F|nr:hypothetical protein [Paraliobacillus ryukyuensis]
MIEKNKEIDDLINDLHSLPEPDYNQRFNADVQDRMYKQIIDYAIKYKRKRKIGDIMKKFTFGILGLGVLLLLLILVNPLMNGDRNNSDKVIDANNMKTIQTYLEYEFTGPNEKLSTIFDKGLNSPELQVYIEENYKPLISNIEQMVSNNYVTTFMNFAHEYGYQLNPVNIDIQKQENTQNNAYNYEVKVEYSKEGQTNTATITGIINLDESGKISLIRKMNDGGLLEDMRN